MILHALNITDYNDEPGMKEFRNRDVKARAVIVLSLRDDISETIKDEAKDNMSTFEKTFTTPGVATQVKLQRKLKNLNNLSHLIIFVGTKIVLNDGIVY